MGVKDILDFVKVEHTLFSLPFVFIGAWIAGNPTALQLTWILIAAVGARGLAMSLNRIIDRNVDADNPRTSGRHLVEGSMSLNTAWGLCGIFLSMLLIGAWQLNAVALAMSWLPVLVFIVYPYTKRVTWTCHLWLGLCLALAPAGAWLGIVGGDLGWSAITELHWYPTIFWICLGVMFWIAAFDLNYALMDIESDRQQGIQSFPARFGEHHTLRTSVQFTLLWFACFAISNPIDEITFLGAALLMCVINAGVIIAQNKLGDFQKTFFYTSVVTGWVLLGGLMAA
ncbi:MAG: UbiA-like polyprenyltransferase [Candidatus Thalassarchaeaceae archaeon]|jgi:4-hydroxybenzoate polyprenyltransferase|nr:UbiA-like polyprenyltransferase [Candidatus Thalassarchaeaceae archaeon]